MCGRIKVTVSRFNLSYELFTVVLTLYLSLRVNL